MVPVIYSSYLLQDHLKQCKVNVTSIILTKYFYPVYPFTSECSLKCLREPSWKVPLIAKGTIFCLLASLIIIFVIVLLVILILHFMDHSFVRSKLLSMIVLINILI